MAVTNWTQGTQDGVTQVSRLGLKNGVSGDRTLFLKQFAGEVLTSFEEKNVAMPLHRVRTIKNGKSAQFPSIGTTSAAYHAAGTQVLGGNVDHGEVTVTVDELLLSAVFVPKIDEAMNHYEVRSTYSKEMGNALANAADKNIFSTILKAATTVSGGDQAGYWAHADFSTLNAEDPDAGGALTSTAGVIDTDTGDTVATGQQIVDAVFKGLQKFDEHNVTGEKFLVLTPEAYYLLFGAQANTIVNTAMNRDAGGNGSVALGQAPTIGGVKVLMSNHLPTASQSTPTPLSTATNSGEARNAAYDATVPNLKGLLFTKDAAATVKLLDLGVESEYQIDRQGTLMVAKYAMGHNVLRGKSAIAIV
jgi:hypothetical protein